MSAPDARADLGEPTAADLRWHAHCATHHRDTATSTGYATPAQLAEIIALHRFNPAKAPLPRKPHLTRDEAEQFCESHNHVARNALGGCGVMSEYMAGGYGTCGGRRCVSCGSNPAQRSSERDWFAGVTGGV